MKKVLLAMVAAATIAALPTSEAKAQFPRYGGFSYYNGYGSGFQQSYGFVNPYNGTRGFINSGAYSTPFGGGFYNNYGVYGGYSYPIGSYAARYPYGGSYNLRYGYPPSNGPFASNYYYGW